MIEKRIELKDGNIILFNKSKGYCCSTVNISKAYLKNNNLLKTLDLTIWDDISFRAVDYDNNSEILELEIDINDPLYFSINRFLDKDNEIIIDDDNTSNRLEKYMIIKREDKLFKIIFINKNNKRQIITEKFGVFIKNIGPDPRSKIDYSFKKRIIEFFRDIEKTLLETYHQVTFDEYIELKNEEKVLKKKK